MRRSLRVILLIVVLLSLMSALWLWWNRPQRVDMAAYVPADTLIYLEANSLPDILTALTSTDAWRSLAPPVGLEANYNGLVRASRLAAWTGLGTAEAVVLSRAQMAVAVVSMEAEEEPNLSLHIRPRLALVVETHTGEARAEKAVLKLIGDFARRNYGEPKIEQDARGDATIISWVASAGGKKIIAALAGSSVIIANDDAALQACLAVRRGEKPSLADDAQLAEMRARVGSADALAFGYVPQAGAPKLTQLAALVLAGRSNAGAREQSGLAILVPQLADRVLGGAAWASRLAGPQIEDFYFFAVPSEIATRLAVALESTAPARSVEAGDFLPAGAYQLTRYAFPEPAEAWGGFNAVISSQLDPTVAPFAVSYLGKMLRPFGVSAPREFLRMVGPEVATARLDEEGEGLMMIAEVRDEAGLREQLRKQFGAGVRATRVGGAEMFASKNPEPEAAALVSGYVFVGDEESVRTALEARASGKTLGATEAFHRALVAATPDKPTPIVTFTDDREAARRVVSALAPLRGVRAKTGDANAFARALAARPYAVSETRLAADGIERLTRSSFGQFGPLVLQFAAPEEINR